ncbi:hypothetical protein GQ55_3G011500 [Panicum hallii var. hallii]|uniref:Uncharacterized protein n=1 Tax=Panicum hallii var. hallii TaxID=1504633 RepID=A0A2T7E4L4_9POAL|nr:hypothetical protein GQ55_3G011500 [Panicum hallii var. hallii]
MRSCSSKRAPRALTRSSCVLMELMTSSKVIFFKSPNCSIADAIWTNLSEIARSSLLTTCVSSIFSPSPQTWPTRSITFAAKLPIDSSFPMQRFSSSQPNVWTFASFARSAPICIERTVHISNADSSATCISISSPSPMEMIATSSLMRCLASESTTSHTP